jgi:regulator of sirC expression with transglutaminase-like and TPR domain
MDPFARFTLAVADPAGLLPLDEATLCVAAVLDPPVDVEANLEVLDALAGSCPAPTLDSLVRHLFGAAGEGFRGNRDDYYDPRNSLVHEVLRRRVGIPITLCIVAMEVGRRLGVPMDGVGMPGHFLLRDKVDPTVFCDPFHGGRFLDAAGCERLFRSTVGTERPWFPGFLDPVPRPAIVARVLANLQQVYERRQDLPALGRVARLRLAMPDLPVAERAALEASLARWN